MRVKAQEIGKRSLEGIASEMSTLSEIGKRSLGGIAPEMFTLSEIGKRSLEGIASEMSTLSEISKRSLEGLTPTGEASLKLAEGLNTRMEETSLKFIEGLTTPAETSLKTLAGLTSIGKASLKLAEGLVRVEERNQIAARLTRSITPRVAVTAIPRDRKFTRMSMDVLARGFDERLDSVDQRRGPLSLVDLYGPPILTTNDEEEEGLARTNKAHEWLMRLEMQVRSSIDERMTSAFGPDWPKDRLPKGMYDQWQQKKRRRAQQRGGRSMPLIFYADFTDYAQVICKRDNWYVFAPIFGRPESVRESFERLHPVRVDTMHARLLTKVDEVLLYSEILRLSKLM